MILRPKLPEQSHSHYPWTEWTVQMLPGRIWAQLYAHRIWCNAVARGDWSPSCGAMVEALCTLLCSVNPQQRGWVIKTLPPNHPHKVYRRIHVLLSVASYRGGRVLSCNDHTCPEIDRLVGTDGIIETIASYRPRLQSYLSFFSSAE